MKALTEEQRVEKAHVQIMGHEATRAYSSIIMVGKSEVSDRIPTAYTNGRDKVYGRKFVAKQTDAELVGLILHECGHVMYQHGYMWKHLWNENRRLANQAADHVINLEIDAMHAKHPNFIKLPEGALLDLRFTGMDTQQVFNILKQEQEDGGDGQDPSDEGGDDAGGDSGDHGGFDEHDFNELTPTEREELQQEVENAIRQGAMLVGKMGGDMPRSFDELTAPKVDWREQLRDYVTEVSAGKDDSTWRKPNRRWLQYDMYLPSTVSESMGKMAVIVDTSGSIDDELVSCFVSEVVGVSRMVTPEQIHLIACDAEVKSHDVYEPDDYDKLAMIRSLKGGGGTNMPAALKYIDDNNIDPEVILVLTDGYTPWPTTLAKPTLWVITTNVVAPIGASIHIEV